MTRTLIAFLAIGFSVVGAVPAQERAGAASAPPKEQAEDSDAVLVIDGEPISSREFGMWLIQTQGEKMAREFAEDHFAVDQEAQRLGIEVTDDEILKHVWTDLDLRIERAFLGSKAEWLKELERTGHTEGGIVRQRLVEYRPRIIGSKIASIDRVVPEDKVVREWQRVYGRNGKKYDVLMMKFRPIVTTELQTSRELWNAEREKRMQEQKDKALAVRARLVAGEDFGKLAREFSADPDTRDHDGKVSGGFTHAGWPRSFLDELEKLGPGDLSQPIYGRGGYWLVKVLSIKETPLESVRASLQAELIARGPEQDEVGAVLGRIKAGVTVKVLPSLYTEYEGREWPSAYEPALEIDGEEVRRGTYARWLRDTLGETFVPLFVQERAVRKAAREQGITVTDAEVDERVREYVQYLIDNGHKGSREAWVTYLEMSGRNEDTFLRGLAWQTRGWLLAEKMMMRERKLTPDELRRFFAETYGEDGRRVDVSWILVNSHLEDADAGWTREELAEKMQQATEVAHELAKDVVARIRKGEDFAELAKKYSEDPVTRDAGGVMQGRFRPDRWGEDVSAAVLALKPGETSDPLAFGTQWLIFRVTKITQVTFDQVKDDLAKELMTQRPTNADVIGYQNSIAKKSTYKILPGMSR